MKRVEKAAKLIAGKKYLDVRVNREPGEGGCFKNPLPAVVGDLECVRAAGNA